MEFIILWIACAFIGGKIGGKKGQGGTGFILGLLFGPVGCLMILAMSGDTVDCPHCRSKISPKATTCPKCAKDISRHDDLIDFNVDNPNFFSFEEWKNIFFTKDKKNKELNEEALKSIFEKEREHFNKENKHYVTKANNNQTESSYLKKLDNDLANLKISMTTYDLLKKKYLSEQKVEIESNEALTSDLDVEQRLNKLSLLKDKGLITDSEYNEKREEILKSL